MPINKVFLGVNHLLGGGLLGLSGRGLLLLLSRGSALGNGLSLGRGPESLVRNVGQCMNKFESVCDLNTYEVVTEKLHDESRVLVALLAQGVELCRQTLALVNARDGI